MEKAERFTIILKIEALQNKKQIIFDKYAEEIDNINADIEELRQALRYDEPL